MSPSCHPKISANDTKSRFRIITPRVIILENHFTPLLFCWLIFTIYGKFTTVVNNTDFVNSSDDVSNDVLQTLRREAKGAGIDTEWAKDCLRLTGSLQNYTFKLVRLNRPSSGDVEREAAPDSLLVLTNATSKALQAAKPFNHVAVPQGQYRLVAPGIVLIYEAAQTERGVPNRSRQVRLRGRTGIVAETLLLNAGKRWSLQELSKAAQVSPALVHRVLTRLEAEGMIASVGRGPARLRHVSNPQALAELWSEEEKAPTPMLRGFLYAASLDVLAKQLLTLYPQGALGGTLAANRYKPVLTRVMPPLRIWVGSDFDADVLTGTGWEETHDGANVELVRAKDDPWRVHRRPEGDIPMVSPWRAWLEIAVIKGRTEELASALFTQLSEDTKWK